LADDPSIPFDKFEFIAINQLDSVPTDKKVDVLGFIHHVSKLTTIKVKDSDKFKRNVSIYDQSMSQIDITLWGNQAARDELENLEPGSILILKGGKMSEYQGVK
jgi:YbbR domain-containing protein